MDEVKACEPHNADFHFGSDSVDTFSNDKISEREKSQTDSLLHRSRRFETMFSQDFPDEVEHGDEQNDEYGVERLEVGSRHLPAEDVSVGLVVSEERERCARLLVSRPKEDDEKGDCIYHADALTLERCKRAVEENNDGDSDRYGVDNGSDNVAAGLIEKGEKANADSRAPCDERLRRALLLLCVVANGLSAEGFAIWAEQVSVFEEIEQQAADNHTDCSREETPFETFRAVAVADEATP